MPKIPSNRVSFCTSCGALIPWGNTRCDPCRNAPRVDPPPPGTSDPGSAEPVVVRTSSGYLYRVVPFVASAGPDRSVPDLVQTATDQLQSLLNRLDSEGWEFVRVESVEAISPQGCLGALLGREPTHLRLDMVVVRRPR